MNRELTTNEAAEILGVTPARIRQMVLAGRLPARKFGRDLVINEADLKAVEDRKPGRPPKPNKEKTAKKAVGKKGRSK